MSTLKSTNRRYLSLIALIVALCITLLLIVSLQIRPAKAAPLQVGVGAGGQDAFEFIGRVNQIDSNFTGFGYLTYIRDLNNTQIYTNNPSEDTARFTYVATATLKSRAILSDVFVINSQGTITFYFTESPPDRNFDDFASFASGTPIATASMRYHDILLVQTSPKGLATGVSEVIQLNAPAFTLNGQSYQFGQPNLFYRFSTIGNGTLTSPNNPLTSFVLLAGNAVTDSNQQWYLPAISRNSN